jgi:hypothetical protein
LEEQAVPLRALDEALRQAGYPVSISMGIAGEATDEQLDALDWEAAFVRWHEPEIHDVYFLERAAASEEDAKALLGQAIKAANNHPESADRLIVADHLRRTRTVYEVQILPALLDDEDHPAWGALDILLRRLAEETDGLIHAEGGGFFDAEGEPLLSEEEPDEEEAGT